MATASHCRVLCRVHPLLCHASTRRGLRCWRRSGAKVISRHSGTQLWMVSGHEWSLKELLTREKELLTCENALK